VQGAFGGSAVEAVAALEVALGVAVGLASAALLRCRAATSAWILAGVLAGTFAVHLAAGYLANLVNAAAFVAAATALAAGTRRAVWVAAGALGAGALAHPLFGALAGAILALAAALAWRRDRAEVLRTGTAVLGGAAILGAGWLALLVGPPAPDVDTSRDAFLRRAGLGGELRSAYLDRFVHRWARYVQWASVPLAALGLGGADGFVGRFLGAWAAALVAGVGAGLATGWFPPDRFLTYGFVVPILAALGLAWVVGRAGRRRWVAVAAAGTATAAMLAGAFVAWNRQEPFVSVEEASAAEAASAVVARTEPGTPLAFLVNDDDASVSFLATRAGNVIRAAVPPDRIRDVVVVVPPLPSARGGPERRALERLGALDLAAAERRAGRPAVTFVLRPFDPFDAPEGAVVLGMSSGRPGLDAVDPLRPSSPGAIVASALAVLAATAAVGFGWARAAGIDPVGAAAVAPALGSAALVVSTVASERLGLAVDGASGAWIASAIAGGGGYLAWLVLQRRTGARPAPEVQE
jgi:hypothetical protein